MSALRAYGDLDVIEITSRSSQAWRLEPAPLGGDQDRLSPVARAHLAVDVVEVGADRARGEPELRGDLLVDHAAGQPPDHLELALGHRARVDGAGPRVRSRQRE